MKSNVFSCFCKAAGTLALQLPKTFTSCNKTIYIQYDLTMFFYKEIKQNLMTSAHTLTITILLNSMMQNSINSVI